MLYGDGMVNPATKKEVLTLARKRIVRPRELEAHGLSRLQLREWWIKDSSRRPNAVSTPRRISRLKPTSHWPKWPLAPPRPRR